ncbi:LTO1 [Symbiodinium sp. CCMP2592]|nr:LTO1 [Symbiodinium sp. CCMP2592]
MQALWPVGAVAGLGAVDCAYLTYSKVTQVPLACPVEGGCTEVLNSSYASIGPLPLSALGLVAYLAVAALSVSRQNKELVFWLCLTMALSSLGLTGILIFVLQAPCPYCAASAFISAMLLTLVETRRARDAERLLEARKATIVPTNEGLAVSAGGVAVENLASANAAATVAPAAATVAPAAAPATAITAAEEEEAEPRRAVLGLAGVLALGALRGGTMPSRRLQNAWAYFTLVEKYKPNHPPVLSNSSKAEMALARHLQKIGAACYSTWWCPHCQEQRESFGKQAVEVAPFVECSSRKREQLPVCRDADIESYPTWIINGKKYLGGRDLSDLAEKSGFTEYPAEAFKPRDDKLLEYIWGPPEPEPEFPELEQGPDNV